MTTAVAKQEVREQHGTFEVTSLEVPQPPRHPWRETAPNILERLRSRFQAARVALVRFERGDDVFEVVATAGTAPHSQFLATGMRWPLAASAVALAASRGRLGHFSTTRVGRPIERIAILLGFRSGLSVPLALATVTLGASIVLWDAAAPPTSRARTRVGEYEPELLQALVAPEVIRRHVLVCHEEPLTAGGLAQLVEAELGATAEVACTSPHASAALATARPDLIILSDHLSESECLSDVAHMLRDAGSSAPLLVLARTDSSHALEDAVDVGATGYLPLAAAASRLPEAAACLLRGRSVLPPRSNGTAARRLSDREHDVLRCLDRGLSDKQIAGELGVAVSTVKTHARGIYTKLGVASRTAALHKARTDGLL